MLNFSNIKVLKYTPKVRLNARIPLCLVPQTARQPTLDTKAWNRADPNFG